MAHRIIAIRDAFKDALYDLPLTGPNVFSGRVYEISNTPSHSIYLGPANALNDNNAFVDEQQIIRDEVLVTGRDDELDELLMNVHAEAYAAILADRTLGLGYVQDTIFLGMAEPDYIDDAKRPALAAVFSWQISYRHSINDTSA